MLTWVYSFVSFLQFVACVVVSEIVETRVAGYGIKGGKFAGHSDAWNSQ